MYSARPSHTLPEWKALMAVKNPTAVKQKERKAPGRQPEHAAAAREELFSPPDIGALPERNSAFDPHLFLTKLVAGKTSQEYRGGEFVFSQGDSADAVFYIQSGKVKLTVVSKRGKEAVVAILQEASFFGEGCLAGQPVRISTATAVQRAVIIRVTREAMLRLLHQEPEFSERFLAYLLARNIRMEADLVDHLFNSSEKRLARLLPLLANFGQQQEEPGEALFAGVEKIGQIFVRCFPGRTGRRESTRPFPVPDGAA